MRTNPRSRRPHDPAAEEGAQALEFTLVIPVALLLTMLVMAAGQVILGIAGLHQLAGTAARVAAVAHDDEVHALLVDAGLSSVDIVPPAGSRRPGDLVTVTLTRQVEIMVIGATMPLRAHATFRTEDPP